MSNLYNFKRIQVVPGAKEFVDIALSKTQRKTPTVVHKSYSISRIRDFYMRKCKFSQQTFRDKLSQIITDFPKLDDVHPFYGDLMNVLYDRDHYKLALGQINAACHQIDNIAKDYLRLLKFGDSLYRCKQLKRACLGRMCTLVGGLKDTLAYLEQVRQHLARLPSIDPNTRTLLITGYPNVGKSSFINKVTRADVEVQPYAFTTKSLFVGHMDYKYLRWQVIDTPGILDHPLEERNTIEMQSITALAHLRACVLYFLDISEQCGYSIKAQVDLFHSIKPLFVNKPLILVVNKIDVVRYESLADESKQLIQSIVAEGATMVESSSFSDEGVMNVKQVACEKLLAARVEQKLRGRKVEDVLNKLHLAQPQPRDDKPRPAAIPAGITQLLRYNPTDPNRPRLERDLEAAAGGAGQYSVDLNKKYLLKDAEWKYDIMPEIWDGKNVADFIDPEIEEKLLALEREEEALIESGFYNNDDLELDDEARERADLAEAVRSRKELHIQKARLEKRSGRNRPAVPRKATLKSSGTDMEDKLDELGHSPETIARARSSSVARKRTRSESRLRSESRGRRSAGEDEEGMAVDDERQDAKRARSSSRAPTRSRSQSGLRDEKQLAAAVKLGKATQRRANRMARAGEGDRVILNAMPKHLFAGKRKMGTNSRR